MRSHWTWAWALPLACALLACSDAQDDDPASAGMPGTSGATGTAGVSSGPAGATAASNAGTRANEGIASPGAAGQSGNRAGGAAGSSGAAGGLSTEPSRGSDAGRGGLRDAGTGGRAGGNSGGAGAGGSSSEMSCPMRGSITYKLAKASAPTAAEQAAYDKISAAMDRGLEIYNCHTNFVWSINVSYVPSVATADGNTNGSIRFGSSDSMNYITAMHETSHTLGVGGAKFKTLVADGLFTGENATRELRAITGDPEAVVHADAQHFWPYGLNYTSEVVSMDDLRHHCRVIVAMRKDLGL